MKIIALSLFFGSTIVANSVCAEQRAPVDEFEVAPNSQATQVDAPAVSNPQAEMYYQLQVLQEEVRQLHGALDEAHYELQQIKQRQMDDYLDLDSRLSALQAGGAAASGSSATAVSPPNAASLQEKASQADVKAKSAMASSTAEKDGYSSAYMLLRDKKIPESIVAFKRYISNYPDGSYVANAYYWLGATHALNGDLALAREAFAMVVDNYPLSRKAEDATLGLAKVYHQMGDNVKAKQVLQSISASGSRAGVKARSYLEENF